ncbi:MAG: TIGR02147 family protein [Myxococcales bacterium]|nr:TIGR02147 family protein [Myxococcales bacterium]MCB9522938.1 TIGR02147 family protein [Myxococcales bacterium]
MVEATQNTPRPDPVAYDDYRAYLRAMVSHLRATEPRFSHRWFARRAGLKTSNYLKLVMDAQRNLALVSVDRFATGLGLDTRERAAFERLVRLAHADTDRARNALYAELRAARDRAPVRAVSGGETLYDLYSQWWTVVIRELIPLAPPAASPGWFAQALHPRQAAAGARQALARLRGLGLAAQDDEGRWRQAERKISTGGQVASLAVRNFHRAMLGLAQEALDRLARDRRHVSAVTAALTPAQYAELTARIDAFRRSVLEELDEAAEGPRSIYQIMFVTFPVSKEIDPCD